MYAPKSPGVLSGLYESTSLTNCSLYPDVQSSTDILLPGSRLSILGLVTALLTSCLTLSILFSTSLSLVASLGTNSPLSFSTKFSFLFKSLLVLAIFKLDNLISLAAKLPL